MDLSLILLICGAAAVIIALLFVFFGYKVSRFLMPLCGVLAVEAVIYLFIYDLFELNEVGTWLFFAGSAIAFYVIFFILRRISGFFAGLMGMGLFLIYVIYAFNLNEIPLLYPALFTLSIIAGLLTVVYKNMGVTLATSLFGAAIAAFAGLYLMFVGVGGEEFTNGANLAVPFTAFLLQNGLLVAGVTLALGAVGALVQVFGTAKQQLAAESEAQQIRRRNEQRRQRDTWVGGRRSSRRSKPKETETTATEDITETAEKTESV